jgi:hypothetical protein
MNIERCSCGAREKNKCSKESEHKTGKMCLKPEDNNQSLYTDEQRLLNDVEYSRQWVIDEVSNSVEWFLVDIYK